MNKPSPKVANAVSKTVYVPVHLALRLCEAIGEQDWERQRKAVDNLAIWLNDHGQRYLADYAASQVWPGMAFIPMDCGALDSEAEPGDAV